MDASYLIDLRRRYSGKDLERRIDTLQVDLFQFEEERILYHPMSQKIWAAVISATTMGIIEWSIFHSTPNLLAEPLAVFFMGSTMLVAWLFAGAMLLETFKPKILMEEAKKIKLEDFMSACECQVVCGRRRVLPYTYRSRIPLKAGYYVDNRERNDVMVSA